jgi:hypothetical protein
MDGRWSVHGLSMGGRWAVDNWDLTAETRSSRRGGRRKDSNNSSPGGQDLQDC